MNTQGWIRGIMAKNMESDKFLRHVAECFSREFGMPVKVIEKDEEYLIKLDQYEDTITKNAVHELKKRGAYTLDETLLDKLRKKGFNLIKREANI
ncbi:MAG: hypothetical protein GX957_03520 [Clostridiaceae bacterium]|nr:hypothetical protein [Clostridiaceae bacterium]